MLFTLQRQAKMMLTFLIVYSFFMIRNINAETPQNPYETYMIEMIDKGFGSFGYHASIYNLSVLCDIPENLAMKIEELSIYDAHIDYDRLHEIVERFYNIQCLYFYNCVIDNIKPLLL